MCDIEEELRSEMRGDRHADLGRRAADEIARLRAALESLTKDPPATLDEPAADWEVITKMRAIARAALSNGKSDGIARGLEARKT